MLTRPMLMLLLGLVASASAVPLPVHAQLRPDRDALAVATKLKSARASASDVARELRAQRYAAAQVGAVLHAVGYAAPNIGQALGSEFRMDARQSAATLMEATNDAALAFQAISHLVRSNAEAMGIARKDLRMNASEAVAAARASQSAVLRKTDTQRSYADLKSVGYATAEIVDALVEEAGSKPGEIYDAMLAQGASLTAIAQELMDSASQSITQIRELLVAKGAPPAEGAAAIDAIGGTGADVLLLLFLELNAQDPSNSSQVQQRAGIAVDYVASGAEAVAALSSHVGAATLAAIAVSIDAARYGSVQAAATAGAILNTVEALVDAGVQLSDAMGAAETLGLPVEATAAIVYAVLGSVDQAWSFLQGPLGWSAGQVEDALSQAIPVTVSFLGELLGLGATPGKIRELIGRLQDMGVSAVTIAQEVGAQLGLLPTAQALWDAGYGASEVTAGLVDGMNATASEAAQVVAGLTNGGA